MSSRAQRGILLLACARSRSPIWCRARFTRAPAPLGQAKHTCVGGERSRSARTARATPNKLLRAPASKSLVAALLGMTDDDDSPVEAQGVARPRVAVVTRRTNRWFSPREPPRARY